MRETSGFSVRPTVNESMLNARRRNSEATRVSTPGLFSTYTTNVFSIGFSISSVRRRLDDRVRTANHFVQGRDSRFQRAHRIFLLHVEIDHLRPFVLMRLLDGLRDFGALIYGYRANSKRVRELHEVG